MFTITLFIKPLIIENCNPIWSNGKLFESKVFVNASSIYIKPKRKKKKNVF